MLRTTIVLMLLSLLQACAMASLMPDQVTDNSGYFADATECYQSSQQKVPLKVPTGLSQSIIEVPVAQDAGAFSNCMQYAGYVVPKVDAESYLELSQHCLNEARDAVNPDAAYSACIRNRNIAVDVIIKRKAK